MVFKMVTLALVLLSLASPIDGCLWGSSSSTSPTAVPTIPPTTVAPTRNCFSSGIDQATKDKIQPSLDTFQAAMKAAIEADAANADKLKKIDTDVCNALKEQEAATDLPYTEFGKGVAQLASMPKAADADKAFKALRQVLLTM